MKSLYTKLIAPFAMTTALTTPMAWAEIPFYQAVGMLKNTQDDKKHLSPFWGMVAVHGKMLEMIRFYGNYATAPNTQAAEDDAENIRTIDQGRDPIARLIRALFNSPDGVQFVATTYKDTAVGNLSQNLDKINNIIEILAEGHVSKPSQTNPMAVNNVPTPHDNLTAEIKKKSLERDKLYEKMKTNRKRMNEIYPQGQSEEIEALNKEYKKIMDDLKLLRKQLEATGAARTFVEPLMGIKRNPEPVYKKIVNVLNTNLDTIDNKELREKIENDNKEFATLLVRAYEAEKTYASLKDHPDQYLYPENIVITALLSFFVKVADDKKEIMEKLPFLMKKDGIINPPDFNKEQYIEIKESYGINDNSLDFVKFLESPELAFLMAQGYDAYENPYLKPIYYGQAPYENTTFPDCGETSLRNVFGIFLTAGNGGIITNDVINNLKANLLKNNPELDMDKQLNYRKLTNFFLTRTPMGATTDVRKEWAEIVSNLNGGEAADNLNDVIYGHSIGNNDINIYEIKADSHPNIKGIVNMLNVIAKLIPDVILNERWNQDRQERLYQVAKKLNRLCKLLSRDGLELSWRNDATKDKNIQDEFVDIIFKNDWNPIFRWRFEFEHFQLDPFTTKKNDWRAAFQTEDETIFPNEWMASLYLKLNENKFIENGNYGKTRPLSLIFTPELRGFDGAMKALSFGLWKNVEYKAMMQFQSLMARWIDKSIPLNDPISIAKISLLLYGVNNLEVVKNILNNQKYDPIRIKVTNILNAAENNPDAPFQNASNNESNTAIIFASRKPGAGRVLNLVYDRTITDATVAKLTNLTALSLSNNEMITDEGLKNLPKLKTLNLENNTTITDEGLKNLTNLTSLDLVGNKMITDKGLKNLTNINTLNLTSNYTITYEGVKNLTNLKTLNLVSNKMITDDGLKNLTNINTLNLTSNYTITDDGLKNLTNLTALNLNYNSTITDKGVKNLTNLTTLNLVSNKMITDDGLKNLTNLTALNLDQNKTITDKGLDSLKNLTILNLNYNENITDEGLRKLEKLTSLNLSSNQSITDKGLENLENLHSLDLSENQSITDKGLEKFKILTNLNLFNNRMITDEGLKNLPNLTTLNLVANAMITDDAIAKLKKTNPNIQIIGR